MKEDESKRITQRARRTKAAVHTVPTSETGRASCSDHVELFELIEHNRKLKETDRLVAADICSGCPLKSGCGFRVFRPDKPRNEP